MCVLGVCILPLLRGEAWSHRTNLTPPHFLKVPVLSQESKRSCVSVLGVSIFPLSRTLIFYFGVVRTKLYFLFLSFYYLYIFSCHDITETLLQLALSANQSTKVNGFTTDQYSGCTICKLRPTWPKCNWKLFNKPLIQIEPDFAKTFIRWSSSKAVSCSAVIH